jgi:hypothetical protein
MAGTLIRVLPRTDFVLSPIGTAAAETPLGSFDTTIFRVVNLIARVHAKSSSGGAGQTLSVLFRNIAPTPDDLTSEFPGATVGTATFSIHAAGTGPMTPQIVACTGAFSYKMRLVLSGVQAVAGTVFTFSLSVDALGQE